MCISACLLSGFSTVFPIHGTLMAVTQLWSMCFHQYSLSTPLFLPLYLCCQISIYARRIRHFFKSRKNGLTLCKYILKIQNKNLADMVLGTSILYFDSTVSLLLAYKSVKYVSSKYLHISLHHSRLRFFGVSFKYLFKKNGKGELLTTLTVPVSHGCSSRGKQKLTHVTDVSASQQVNPHTSVYGHLSMLICHMSCSWSQGAKQCHFS